MYSHLLVSVTFLQPTCHARMGKQDAAPNEWPPSPLRVFQAMVAGAAARWASDSDSSDGALTAAEPLAALRWLESLCASSPPTIYAPRAVTGHAVPYWVPNNSADLTAWEWAKGDALATFSDRTLKHVRPTHMLDGSTVHYVWPLAPQHRREAAQYAPAITAAARSIVALGWGIDAAIGDARLISDADAGALAGERWLPDRPGSPGHRLPINGTLDALTQRHAAFLSRMHGAVFHPVPALRTFATASYRRATDLPARPFAAFVLRPPATDSGFASVQATRAVFVAAMLRHAACKAAQQDIDPSGWRTDEWSLRFVAGHGPLGGPKKRTKDDTFPRLSYLPLPTIGHAHADGTIRRVIIAEPFGGDGRSARWASLRLAGAELIDEDSRSPVARLQPIEPDEPEFASVFPLYASRSGERAATTWVSVTPVILPGFDDRRQAKRERRLLDCLHHAGIDASAVEAVESRPTPWQPVRGGAIANQLRAFKRPSYLYHLPAVHVRVTFSHPVAGPIALGAGRHCGLGVLAAE